MFTARGIFAARAIEARGETNGLRPTGPDDDVGDWAIGVVEDHCWEMPRWARCVLLTHNVHWKGQTDFVDGRRAGGVLTHFLPIAEGGVGCSRTRPVQYAAVDRPEIVAICRDSVRSQQEELAKMEALRAKYQCLAVVGPVR